MQKIVRVLATLALAAAFAAGCGAAKPAPAPSTPAPAPSAPAQPAPIIGGSVTIDLNAMKEIQKQVDAGQQPWFLDPLQVARQLGARFGFDPGADQFTLVRQAEKGAGGTGEALVEATHAGTVWKIQLTQPLGPGKSSIWMINSILQKQR